MNEKRKMEGNEDKYLTIWRNAGPGEDTAKGQVSRSGSRRFIAMAPGLAQGVAPGRPNGCRGKAPAHCP